MFKKNLLKVAFAFAMFLSLSSSVFAIDIYYKNAIVPTDSAPVIENGRTLVPISSIAKSMGAQVTWNAATKTATIKKDTVTIELVLGSTAVSIDKAGQKSALTLDVPAKSINGRTMVPVRAISEIFGNKVEWDKDTSSVLIDSDKPKSNISTSNNSLEQSILNGLKDYSGLYDIVNSFDDAEIELINTSDDVYSKYTIAKLNERIPGKYVAFSINPEKPDTNPILGYYNTNTKKIYIDETEVIFTIPDYKVIVPPFRTMITEDLSPEYDTFIRVIAKNAKMVDNDEFTWEAVKLDEQYQQMSVNIYKKGQSENSLVGKILIDKNERTVTNEKTNKVIFDDSAVTQYKEKFIKENQVGETIIPILKKLQILEQNQKYTVTDIKEGSGEAVEQREGYFVTIKSQDGTEVGKFFINNTSTVVMQFDYSLELYYYVYGAYTPFG